VLKKYFRLVRYISVNINWTWDRAARTLKAIEYDPKNYPPIFADTYFKGTGRSIENEIFFNHAQQALIESESGIFSMTESAIGDNIRSLQAVGIDASRDMFVNDLI